MPCLYLKRHERAATNVLFCCRHSDPFCRATLFLTRILAIPITMWIALCESSHGVMPCIVVISVLPQERVHNAFYPRRATQAVSGRIRKISCCQESAGCSKELLKIREIQKPRKRTSVAHFFKMSTIRTFVT